MNSASTQTSELQEATEMRAAEKADNLKTIQESGESWRNKSRRNSWFSSNIHTILNFYFFFTQNLKISF